jgi:hypothetical protein
MQKENQIGLTEDIRKVLSKAKLNNKADEIWNPLLNIAGSLRRMNIKMWCCLLSCFAELNVLIEIREKTKAELLPAYPEF